MKFGNLLKIVLVICANVRWVESTGDDTCFTVECNSDEEEEEDPRDNFVVDMGNYVTPADLNVSEIVREMSTGKNGFVVISGLFEDREIDHARRLIKYLIRQEAKLDVYEPKEENHPSRFRIRVWNLLNKGRIFQKMVQHPLFVAIASETMGEDFQLGTVLSNSILPGGSGQEPHLDYPYWDFFNRRKWPQDPKHVEGQFFMNWKATIMLDPFTDENGATAVRPGTQVRAEYPWDHEEFWKHQKQVNGNPGDVMMFFGLLQHCAMPNRSQQPRTGLILQYLPKYIRPMEDLRLSVSPKVIESASPALRKMLLVDYPYPAVLDKALQEVGSRGNPKYDI